MTLSAEGIAGRLASDNSSGWGFAIQGSVYGTAGKLNFFGNGGWVGQSDGTVATNTWTHVAITRSGNSLTFYINGNPSGSFTNGNFSGSFDNGLSLVMGDMYPSWQEVSGGSTVSLTKWISSTAPSPAEILAIYDAGVRASAGVAHPAYRYGSWWGGDNNALDMIGTNHGTLQGGATFAPGMVGQAFSFDGVDDYIEVPHSASLNLTGGLTLETWFKVRSAGYATLFSKSDSNGSQSVTSYGFQIDPDGSINVALYGTYPADNWTTAAGLVTTGQWYHVALTWDGTYGPSDNVKLYLNGALVQTWTKSLAPLNVTTQTLTLGSMKPPTYYGHMDGLIDEAGIFNRVLSAEEIAAIYAAGSAGICSDGDGVAPSVEDAAPNNGDGNGDGAPDSQQAHVASLPSATGSGYVTVVVSGGCSQIQSVATYTAASQGNDPNFDYPYGLVGFTIPCSTATVKVIFHNAANLNGFTYRKFGPTPPAFNNPQWYTLPGVTFGTEVIGGQTVATATFTLTDGQLGDDTDVDGVIVDQGGPGLPVDQTGPSLAITSHTNNQDVNTASITLSGTASDSGKGDNGIQTGDGQWGDGRITTQRQGTGRQIGAR